MYAKLMKVSRGFKLVYIGLLLIVASIVGVFIAVALVGAAVAAGRIGLGFMAVFVLIVGGLLSFAGTITSLIGKIFCLAIPERAGPAKQLIAISIALEVVGMVLGNLNLLGSLAHLDYGPMVSQILTMGGALLNMSATALFLLFTKYAAQFIHREDLADTALSVLWLFVTAIGFFIVGIVVMVIMAIAGGAAGAAAGGIKGAAGGAMVGVCIGGIVLLTGGIFWLIGLIRFIVLMTEMSNVVARYAGNIRRTKRSKPKRREEEDDEGDDSDDDDDDRPRNRRKRKRWDDDEDDDDDYPHRHRIDR
ncbi:MAG TPA: hypothetical protein VG122_16640 [Gemmata sp.]|jgi:hypothetical protein|nr:hypothetical protein [Gemmata sp.]